MRELIDRFLASATWTIILFVVFPAVVLWAALR
jgi:cbb3-type cytochrome oxidase subunit 3